MKLWNNYFDKIMEHKEAEGWPILFRNLPSAVVEKIKEKLRNQNIPGFYDVVIEFNKDDQKKVDNIVQTVDDDKKYWEDIIWRDYFLGVVFERLLSHSFLPQEELSRYIEATKKYIRISDCRTFEEYRKLMNENSGSITFLDVSFIDFYVRKVKETVTFHFVNCNDIRYDNLQKQVNIIVSWRSKPTSRVYTTDNSLISYCVGVGSRLQSTHDYHDYDGSELVPVVVKRKIMNFK
jgi:hypothetical protein